MEHVSHVSSKICPFILVFFLCFFAHSPALFNIAFVSPIFSLIFARFLDLVKFRVDSFIDLKIVEYASFWKNGKKQSEFAFYSIYVANDELNGRSMRS